MKNPKFFDKPGDVQKRVAHNSRMAEQYRNNEGLPSISSEGDFAMPRLAEYPYMQAKTPDKNKALEASLADGVVWESYQVPSFFPTVTKRSMADLRAAMHQARKFRLDDAMSAFLADLASRPFSGEVTPKKLQILDSMRHSARLPFPKTWVEYNNHAFRFRLVEVAEKTTDVWNAPLETDLEKVFKNIGWLLEEDPIDPNIIHMSYFLEELNRVITPPFTFVYNTVDQDFPDRLKADPLAGSFAHGLMGHFTGRVGVIMTIDTSSDEWINVTDGATEKEAIERQLGPNPKRPGDFKVHRLVPEFGGVVRYAMAFLSTLTESPTTVSEVRPSRGYMAKGNYKQFMSHHVLKLNLPKNRDLKLLANKVLKLSRIGGHEVMAHWRTYTQGRGFICSDHAWPEGDRAQCTKCNAMRVWIVLPHGRGDWSIQCKTKTYEIGHRT